MQVSENLLKWLANGERGTSSETIVQHITGIKTTDWKSHPYDPDDLRRCRILLVMCPELKADFGKMKTLSKVWENLVNDWDSLCKIMDDERPNWKWQAPKTYQRMKKLGC